MQGEPLLEINDYYGFDLDASYKENMKVAKRLQEERDKLLQEGYVRIDIEDSTSARAEFYALYGGMFILGDPAGTGVYCWHGSDYVLQAGNRRI